MTFVYWTQLTIELEVILKSGLRKTTRVEYHRAHFKDPITTPSSKRSFVRCRTNT